jgi:hypothetical protein
MRRVALLPVVLAASLLTLAGCSDAPAFQVGPYPVTTAPPITPDRTLTDSKGLEYLVDDSTQCVQIAFGDGSFSDCVPFEQVGAQSVSRAADQVIAVLIVGGPTAQPSAGARLIASWFTPLHDRTPEAVDAIELKTGVYAVAYRSPVDVPIWGMQLRAEDGRLLNVIAIAGQYLTAPR